MTSPAEQPQLVVPVDVVARKLRVAVSALTGDQRITITDEILDAQDAVAAYLNRPLFPSGPHTETEVPAKLGEDLTSWRAWPTLFAKYDDDLTILSAVEDGLGTYTVEFTVGIDARTIRPIYAYVRAHAAEAVRNDPSSGMGKRRVSSLNAEGQSISYDNGSVAQGAAGALPRIESLKPWRRYSAYKPNRPASPPWPMASNPVGWDPR